MSGAAGGGDGQVAQTPGPSDVPGSDAALPSFVLGFHGCDRTLAEAVFAGDAALESSENDYDWLGGGVYFWEHNARRAFEFARDAAARPHPSGQKIREPAVVGAVIDLGRCLNLLDARDIALVRDAYALFREAVTAAGGTVPENVVGPDSLVRRLDCAVIQTVHA